MPPPSPEKRGVVLAPDGVSSARGAAVRASSASLAPSLPLPGREGPDGPRLIEASAHAWTLPPWHSLSSALSSSGVAAPGVWARAGPPSIIAAATRSEKRISVPPPTVHSLRCWSFRVEAQRGCHVTENGKEQSPFRAPPLRTGSPSNSDGRIASVAAGASWPTSRLLHSPTPARPGATQLA
jgi:hypothetical protein